MVTYLIKKVFSIFVQGTIGLSEIESNFLIENLSPLVFLKQLCVKR
jgi:hypothetical protein